MKIELTPIATVSNKRTTLADDHWGEIVSEIHLDDAYPASALAGLDAFSHVEVIYFFDRVKPEQIVTAAEHPRENPAWPKVGIFAQRKKSRPNRLGLTTAKIISVEGRCLTVQGLDAIDGTPVLDLKPVMQAFLPREAVQQPAWSHDLMRAYW